MWKFIYTWFQGGLVIKTHSNEKIHEKNDFRNLNPGRKQLYFIFSCQSKDAMPLVSFFNWICQKGPKSSDLFLTLRYLCMYQKKLGNNFFLKMIWDSIFYDFPSRAISDSLGTPFTLFQMRTGYYKKRIYYSNWKKKNSLQDRVRGIMVETQE